MQYSIIPQDHGFIAVCEEYPSLSAFGATEAEALTELEGLVETAIEIYEEEGWE